MHRHRNTVDEPGGLPRLDRIQWQQMGRIAYESPRVAATAIGLNGAELAGEAYCRVRVMDPHENAFGPDWEGSMRRLRRRLASDGTFAAAAPRPALRAPDAIIPRSIFEGLPDASAVSFHWEFHASDGACGLPAKPD